MLRGVGLPDDRGTIADFVDLVLGTPQLHRSVSGILLDADAGGSSACRSGPRSVPAGLSIGADVSGVIPPDVRDPAVFLERRLARMARAGVTFSGWTHIAGAGSSSDESSRRVRFAAAWAQASRDVGLPAVLNCTVRTSARATMSAAEDAHTAAIAELMEALRSRCADLRHIVLGINPIAPGPRAPDVATADDIAYATARRIRTAGLDVLGGVIFGGAGPAIDLPAVLLALGRRRVPARVGFRIEAVNLTGVAVAWGGRADRVGVARREMRLRLDQVDAVRRAENE